MAVYRQISISFWQDPFVLDLTPEQKYFYLYLMTNSKTRQCGCYEISVKTMELETGYNNETIQKLLSIFKDKSKIEYCQDTNEILIKNWHKHNSSRSPKVKACIEKEVLSIKNKTFKKYCIDTLSIDYPYTMDTGLQKEKEKEKEIYSRVIDFLNSQTGKSFKSSSRKTKSLIDARLNEGFTEGDFCRVIKNKSAKWKADPKMAPYLRPETLFGTKFESYLNENDCVKREPKVGDILY